MEGWQVFAVLAVAAVVGAIVIISGQAPEASFEIHPDQTRYDAPATLTFTDTSVARGGRLIRWQWNFGDGSPVRTVRDPGPHTFRMDTDEPKAFTITLTVWNSRGRQDTAQKTIVVRPAPKPEIRNIVADPPLERLTNIHVPIEVTLEAFAEQEGRPHVSIEPEDSFVWVLTNITRPAPQQRRVGRKASFSLTEAGEYNIVLTVTNTGGRSETWSHKLILNPAQRSSIDGLVLTEQSGVYPLTTTANFSATHPNMDLLGAERLKLKYEIDWGDGTSWSAADVIRGQSVRDEHTYTRPGRYTATFRVFSDLLPGRTEIIATRSVEVKHHMHYMMPAWSPDFRQIAFVYRDDARLPFYEIRLATLQTEQVDGLWRIRGESFSESTLFKVSAADRGTNILPTWEPSGDRLAIMSDVDGQRTSDLYAVSDRDTSSRLTRLGDATAAMPTWMPEPEDDFILFTSNRDHTDRHQSYLLPGIDADIPGERTPEIALAGNYELYRLDTKSGGISRITYSSYSHRWPSASPDGSRVAFEMRDNIYTASLAAADSDVTLVVGSPYTDTFPRWNQVFDNLIAFMRYRQNRWETWVYDLDARTESPVSVEEAVDVLYPSWSPDGRYLVCQKRTQDGWRLVVYEVADQEGDLRRGAVVNIVAGP